MSISNSFLVFDIETILDPELTNPSLPEPEKLPSPPHHQVVAIGALLLGPDYCVRKLAIIEEGKPEQEILQAFAKIVHRDPPLFVSFNGRGFDFPVIASRCFRHAIPLRNYYSIRDMRYRFSETGHFDLMDYLSDFGASKSTSLDVFAKMCGMPGKVCVSGKDVAWMVKDGKITEIGDYCLSDVVQTAAVFLRLELVRGTIKRDVYDLACKSLTELINTNDRLSILRQKE